MKRKYRPITILYIDGKWCIFYNNTKLYPVFELRSEAEERKKYLMSR